MKAVSATEAKTKFAALLKLVAKGERIIIRQRERPVAALISAAELSRLENSVKQARESARALGQNLDLLKKIEAGKIHPAMAAFGLWRDAPEFALLTEQIYSNRIRQLSRAEVTL